MTVLNEAQEALRAHLATGLTEVDPLAAVVPAHPVAWGGYVWQAPAFIEPAEDGGFCATRSVGLVLDLVAGVTDLQQSQRWLNDRIDEVWAVCAGGISMTATEDTVPERVARPIVVRTEQGVELLVVRVEFARFNLEV